MTHVLSDLVKRLSSAGFDEVIISMEYVDRTMVKIANSQPSVAQSWSEVLIDLYLTKDKKILVTSMTTSDLDEILRETPRLFEQINSLEPSFIYAKIPEPDREVSSLTNLVQGSC
jgi:PmbA protein